MIKEGLTLDQLEAVTNTGGPLLVSAAAGSGKTMVLVERLLNRVTAEGSDCSVDDFLIITYTVAAASELRGKILNAIYERIAAEPDNARLRRQAAHCAKAKIGTIHSFCVSVIRENAHLLGISPGFRVAEEAESDTIKDEVLSRLVEEAYSRGDEEFFTLADTMGAGRDDSGLIKIILSAHSKLMSHPYPEKWVEEQLRNMDLGTVSDLSETVWGELLLEKARKWCVYALKCIDGLLADDPVFTEKYGESLKATKSDIAALSDAAEKGWDRARAASVISFPRTKNLAGYDDKKAVRNRLKKEAGEIAELLSEPSDRELDDLRRTFPVVRSLLNFVLDFDRAYSEEKRRRSVLDFSDQEHLALRILTDADGEPTETARQLSRRFTEIMVDEFQDVNEIQERLFRAVSRDGKNLFMVGDVKQSIYRFRLADPTIFLRKYNSYKDSGEAAEGEGRRVILSRNFRSRSGILDAVNFVFKNVMSAEFGEMDYTDREALYPGYPYGEPTEPEVELDVIDCPAIVDSSADKAEFEAEFAAQRILELMDTMTVEEKSGPRRLQYGDIAILMPAPRAKAARWKRILEEKGIPVSFGDESAFFETPEISIAMSLAAVVDNPRQDVPLVTAMRSPVYGFTSEELAQIRAVSRDCDFYACVEKAAESDEKCRGFVSDLRRFRLDARDMPSDEFLWHLFNETGFFAAVNAMPSGEKRYRNVMTLLDAARSFESLGYRGLYGFNKYMERLMADDHPPASQSAGSDGNAVQLMSIHKSKGLEFPVVFLADLSKGFNRDDTKEPLLLHSVLGAGPRTVDMEKRISYPSIARRAVKERITAESMAEELRVLYVAMTRPREKLIMLCSYRGAQRSLKKFCGSELPVPPSVLETAGSLSDFVLYPALRREECAVLRFGSPNVPVSYEGRPWTVRLVNADELEDSFYERIDEKNEAPIDEEALEKIREGLDWQYPHRQATLMPSKVTATELKGAFRDEETHEDAIELRRPVKALRPPKRPDFDSASRGLTSAERGVAAHLVMQYADYDLCRTVKGAAAEIERLRLIGNLTDEEAKAVRPEIISAFFNSETGREVLSAERVWRELKFSLLVKSEELPGFDGGEEILLQGVVDCCADAGDTLTVIDFKTDRVTRETVHERAEYYRGQLEAYSTALRRILKKPVGKRVLYFLTAGIGVEV